MRLIFAVIVLSLGLFTSAEADIWKWVDDRGETHFVDSDQAIFTWVDEFGKVHFGDKPDHPDAIRVQLVWHYPGTLADLDEPEKEDDDPWAYPGETAEERAEREAAEAYYCKRATEILDSYLNAPNLYRTNDAGEREILSEEEAKATIADAEARTSELCG
jgi:hypothetical protein